MASSIKVKIPDLVTIPAGDYVMGISDDQITHLLRTELWAEEWFEKDLFAIEQPQHSLKLIAFQIALGPVTNQEYYNFVWSSGYKCPKEWVGFKYPEGSENHPVVGLSLLDAQSYCTWLNEVTGGNYRLLSEVEWEAAARAGDDRLYPWGEEFDPWRCNTLESGKRSTTAVGEYSPSGDSPFGIMDMAGNVWEWTISSLKPYPYKSSDGRENSQGREKIVIRGGSWYYSHKLARTTAREGALSNFTSPALGFRIGRSL